MRLISSATSVRSQRFSCDGHDPQKSHEERRAIVIRSYVRVFRLQRRIYSFGDWVLPLPNGIPLLGMTYFCAALLLSLLLWKFPPTGLVFGVFPWPVRHVILPLWIAAAGMTFSPDGRRADLFLLTWLQLLARRVRSRVLRPSMEWGGKLRVRYDASDTVLHRAQITGPATVAFAVPVELNDRWHGWAAEGGSGECREVPVRADQALRICP